MSDFAILCSNEGHGSAAGEFPGYRVHTIPVFWFGFPPGPSKPSIPWGRWIGRTPVWDAQLATCMPSASSKWSPIGKNTYRSWSFESARCMRSPTEPLSKSDLPIRRTRRVRRSHWGCIMALTDALRAENYGRNRPNPTDKTLTCHSTGHLKSLHRPNRHSNGFHVIP